MLSVLNTTEDNSVISLDVNDFATLISIEVSLLKSEISVLNVWNVSEDKSLTSTDVSLLNSLISRDSSLEV